jgi:hypothetical protein
MDNNNMKNIYHGDLRYEKIAEQMQLLGIQDVSTERQQRNGTIVWRLPIKNWSRDGSNIEVAAFSTGYVRNQNSGYSNYQLNKRCESEPHYYPEQKYNLDTNEHVKTGKYLKFTTRGCKLIPIEIDRLEYMMKYCVKNYYIKHANQVPNGEFIPKWEHESELVQLQDRHDMLADAARLDYNSSHKVKKIGWRYGNDDEISVTINGHKYKVK